MPRSNVPGAGYLMGYGPKELDAFDKAHLRQRSVELAVEHNKQIAEWSSEVADADELIATAEKIADFIIEGKKALDIREIWRVTPWATKEREYFHVVAAEGNLVPSSPLAVCDKELNAIQVATALNLLAAYEQANP